MQRAAQNTAVIRLKDWMPLDGYYRIFQLLGNKYGAHTYILDLEGIEKIEEDILGLILMVKQYAEFKEAKLEVKYHNIDPGDSVQQILQGF